MNRKTLEVGIQVDTVGILDLFCDKEINIAKELEKIQKYHALLIRS